MHSEEIDILVIDAQAGDKKAFETLYSIFKLPLRRFALVRVQDAMVAEDLVQNVWIKLMHRLVFLKDISLFRSWLYRSLRWEIIDWQRTQRFTNTEVTDETSIAPALNTDVLDIVPLLKTLSADERDVVELFYLTDLSLHETSLALDIPSGTAKSRLARAREKLKQHYND